MDSTRIGRQLAFAVVATGIGTAVLGQTAPLFHDPWLNWDFVNFTGQPVNDFEIVVETPNWSPHLSSSAFVPKKMALPS